MVKTHGGWLLSALFLGCLAVAGCGSQSEFSNKLTFGTGVGGTGFDLIGEADTFSLSALGGNDLWFRLESAEDIGDRFVRLYFNDGLYLQKDYPLSQNYGHIFLANFHISDVGTYQVEAYLPETIIDIADESHHVADATLTITQ